MCLLCGKTWKDGIRNENIHRLLGVTTIKDKFIENRVTCFGHIQRGDR